MMHWRRRIDLPMGREAYLHTAVIQTNTKQLSRALYQAKGLGNKEIEGRIKRLLWDTLDRWFAGFDVCCPVGGQKAASWIHGLFVGHPRWLGCFDYGTVLGVSNHWISRLDGKLDVNVPLAMDVRDRWVVCVDDVMTTGMTMARHLKSLCDGGAYAVGLVWLGHGGTRQ